MNKLKRAGGVLAILWLGIAPLSSVFADTSVEGQKWVDSLKFGGDLRLRGDGLLNSGGKSDRSRERFRLRFGAEFTTQDLLAALRFASGSGSQLSANQTEGAAFGQKPLWIDLAYLQYKPQEYVKLVGGRMPNAFWQLYASDSMWDPDLNPEGTAEKVEIPADERLKVFANFAQMPISEVKGNESDPWMFGEQVGAKATLFEETRLTMAIADYGFMNETKSPLFGSVIAADATNGHSFGNSRTAAGDAGILTSPFNILQFTSELAFHAGPVPLSLQGDFVTNTRENLGRGRNGYQTGFIAGKASAAHTWEGAYFYKYLQDNATIADFADDDFGNGGTNRAGHIFWVAYSPRDYVQFKLKYYITRVLNQALTEVQKDPVYDGDINRVFVDVMVKF